MSEPARDGLTVHIGAREIYDEIVGLRSDVRTVVVQHADVAKDVNDHESRLRSLEKWKYAVPASAVIAVVSGLSELGHATGIL